jgi:hypothetical protein
MTDYGEIKPEDRERLDLMVEIAQEDKRKLPDLIDLAYSLGYCNGRLDGANKLAERFEALIQGNSALPTP